MKTARQLKREYFAKDLLKYLLLGGIVLLGASSPQFSFQLAKRIWNRPKPEKRKIENTFYYLKKKGLIVLERRGYNMRVVLTKAGKKRAGKYQIDELTIERPKQWDGKWRIVIFDIPNTSSHIRDVFRYKLKEFGFYRLQKSVWIYPFPCQEEIVLLRAFLGASVKEILFFEVGKMENDTFLRKIFHL